MMAALARVDNDLTRADLPSSLRRVNDAETIVFDSRSEAAIAITAERYVPGWRCETGRTFQIPIGFGKTCDFLFGEHLYHEHHPIILSHEFQSKAALEDLTMALKRVPGSVREDVYRALKREMLAQYARTRTMAIRAVDPKGELVITTSAQEVYKKLLQRVGQGLPQVREFLKEWDAAIS